MGCEAMDDKERLRILGVIKEVGGEFIGGFWEPENQREYVVFSYCGCEFTLQADLWFTPEAIEGELKASLERIILGR